jgi:NB-ARC domain
VTPEEFLADVAIVYTGDSTDGAFGSGRLIAPGLVLTAGHVVDYPTRQAPMRTGWKVRVVRERAQSGAWVGSSHEAELVWRGSGDLDLALLRITGDPVLVPTVKPVFASYHSIGSIDDADAAGFPQAWFSATDTVRDYIVRGSLRIATQYGSSAPYAWSVPAADKPDDPRGWKGMSGAAVCKVGPNQELYLFGTVQEVPANFSGGLLEVAQLSAAFANDDFCNALRNSLGFEPRIISWIGSISTRVLVPSVQAPTEYIDRLELTQPLLTHLLDGQAVSGHAIISAVHGLGGIGKTTIARWLVWRPEIERRFADGRIWITLGDEPPDALTIINDCVSQLDPALKAKATVEAARTDLATLLRDRSILFVVDDVWPGRSADIAKALLVPSSHCRFLLTTRFSRLADDPAIGAVDFRLDEMSADQAKELITHALGRELSLAEEPVAESLCETVGGHPLALELAAARIREGRSWSALLSDLGAEIAHLDVLEEADDDLIELPVTDQAKARQKSVRASLLLSVRSLRREGQELFAWLGVISEDATITPRMAATLWGTDEKTAFRHLRSLSGAGMLKAEGDVYRIHDLMHDLARELLTAPVAAARERDIPGLGLTLQDASRQLLERYRAKTSDGLWHTLPEDGYIHDHLVQVFEWANWKNEIENLLWEESADGHCGWHWARECLGQTAGFIADVNRIWFYADRVITAAATEGDKPRAIALQLHCALIVASINSVSAGIAAEVLAGAVRYGLLAFPIALSLARQNPDGRSRVFTSLALANEMPPGKRPGIVAEALNTARGINDTEARVVTLAAVASRLSLEEQANVVDEALTAARDIYYGGSRVRALVAVAPLLPLARQASVHAEALNTARGVDDGRAEALATVAPRLSPQEQASVLAEALTVARGMDDAGSRAWALAAIAPRLSPEAQPSVVAEALNDARGIHDFRRDVRDYALAAIAPLLPSQEAFVVARTIDDAKLRVDALVPVASRLSPEAQSGVFEEALNTARGIDDARLRSEALALVASRLSAEAQPSVFQEALNTGRGIDDGEARVRALAAVAPRLSPEAQPSVLQEALNTARGINVVGRRVQALAAVAPLLPLSMQSGVLGEALGAARSFDDELRRAQALAAVAPHLSPEEQPSVLREMFSVANGFDNEIYRGVTLWLIGRTLRELAEQLPPEEALMIARSIDDASVRAEVLAAIALRLPPGEVLMLARGIDNAFLRSKALAAVVPRLSPEEQPSVLQEALSAARSIDGASLRVQALAAVALQLPPEEQPTVLDDALSAARGIDNAKLRAEALVTIVPQLTPEEQPSVLSDALNAARAVDGAFWRSGSLAAVIPVLLPENALMVARGIDDARWRAEALAVAAARLPLETQRGVLEEALNTARSIDDAAMRAEALAEVAPHLPPEDALVVARGIDSGRRTLALRAIAARLKMGQITPQWVETVRALAVHARSDCINDLIAIIPIIEAIGGETALRGVARSIISVGLWWQTRRSSPSQPALVSVGSRYRTWVDPSTQPRLV